MTSALQILTTRNFNGLTFDCYHEDGQDVGDFWATREQIGQLLEYNFPGRSIGKIHSRNKERLDKFSRVTQIDLPSGGTQMTTIYNFKGFLEICRFSNQPKANAVIDFAWNIMDEIRRTGSYGPQELNPVNIRAAEVLQKLANMLPAKGEQREVIYEAIKLVTGIEIPKKAPEPAKPQRYWTAQQIAKSLKWPADAVMHRAENLGITKKPKNGYWDGEVWYFSKEGRAKFLELVAREIVKIEGDFAYYEDGHKHIYWRFEAE